MLSEWRLSEGRDCLSLQIQSMLLKNLYLKFWKILIKLLIYCEGTSTKDFSGGDEQSSEIKNTWKTQESALDMD